MAYVDLQVLEIYNECNILGNNNCQIDVGDVVRVGCYVYWNDGNLDIGNIPIILRFYDEYATEFHAVTLTGRSDSEGWFAENYTVTANDINELGSSGHLCVLPYSTESDSGNCRQILYNQTCEQSFVVVDQNDTPIAGARIYGDWSPYPLLCTTGQDGTAGATFDLEPGYDVYYSVYAEKDGYDCITGCNATFLACSSSPVELVLTEQTPYCTQPVAVKDVDGAWIGGISVVVPETGEQTITFNYDIGGGRNTSVFCPTEGNTYTVRTESLGYTSDTASFRACTAPIDLVIESLGETCTQHVKVVRRNGSPVDHAEVEVWSNEYDVSQMKLTNEFGLASFELLVGEPYYAQTCTADGLECVSIKISPACTDTVLLCPECGSAPLCMYTGNAHDAKIDHYSVPESAAIGSTVRMSVSVDNTALVGGSTTYYVEFLHMWDSTKVTTKAFQLDAIGEQTEVHSFVMPDLDSATVKCTVYRCTESGWELCPHEDAVMEFTIDEGADMASFTMLAIYGVVAVGVYAGGSFLPGKAGKVAPVLAIIPAGLAAYEGYKIVKERYDD